MDQIDYRTPLTLALIQNHHFRQRCTGQVQLETVRKIIYTTNTVEAIHRQFRKLRKTKGVFPKENSLLKLLCAGILNAIEKWSMPIQNWSQVLSQLDIYFEGRLNGVLDI